MLVISMNKQWTNQTVHNKLKHVHRKMRKPDIGISITKAQALIRRKDMCS